MKISKRMHFDLSFVLDEICVESSDPEACQEFIKSNWRINETHGLSFHLYNNPTNIWNLTNLTCRQFGFCEYHNIQWNCNEVGTSQNGLKVVKAGHKSEGKAWWLSGIMAKWHNGEYAGIG